MLFSLFRTLLALFLISVVSCSRSSLVFGSGIGAERMIL
uniref:Lipoprotein n=1 Tax=Schistosoma japonicum TaxID=6182 RepID=Q5C1C5_SCHJA|nr:unknown [Schistosoma japonicum]